MLNNKLVKWLMKHGAKLGGFAVLIFFIKDLFIKDFLSLRIEPNLDAVIMEFFTIFASLGAIGLTFHTYSIPIKPIKIFAMFGVFIYAFFFFRSVYNLLIQI